jgi:gamma-glutamyltranspeptidase/glutathione hydrolase
VVTEAMKLGLADRDEYYGDPRFTKVPVALLLSDPYTRMRRPLINMQEASLEVRPGDPYRMRPVKQSPALPSASQGGTTVLCLADRWGNVVAATPSGLGSSAGVAGDTGIIHGARLVSLNTWKGHPNCIEPGKRPRITLTPTLVLKNGKPVLAIAVAGGDLQDQVSLQLILDRIDFGMDAESAFQAPRFATRHHTGSFGQDRPRLGSLQLSAKVSESVREELKRRGHQVTISSGEIGGAAILSIDPASHQVRGAGPSAARVE